MNSQKSLGMEMRSLNILCMRKISELTGIPEADEQVTFMHGRIIEFLYMNQDKEVFQRDIEHHFEIRRPTATRLLQSMEKRGSIKRQGVDYDARLKQIILTEKALQIHQKMIDIFTTFETELVKGIDEEDLITFFHVIEKMKRNIGEI